MKTYLRNIKIYLTVFFTISLYFQSYTQKDTININEVEINSDRIPTLYSQTSRIISVITKQEIQQMPVQSVDEVLKHALNVDVRNRGDFGVQSDISIRGGSSEQTLILLNGVKINDPQTSHHNINIPVDINDIERIEILEGPASRIFGPNAFSGAINIITTSQKQDNIKLAIAGGENQYFSGSASANFHIDELNNYVSLSKKASDGYMADTDFDMKNFLYQADYKKKGFNMNLLTSYLDKAFGANSFYSAKYPSQFEHTKTSFVNLKTSFGKKLHWTANIYWRTNQDKYVLIRDNPSVYTNYHLTNTEGIDVNTYYLSKLGKTAIGGEVRREEILSNRLGDVLRNRRIPYSHLSWGIYDHGKKRDNVNIFAEHAMYLKDFSFSAGLLANWASDYRWNIYPGIDMSHKITDNFKVIASVNKSLRMPSFTDLYYQGPINTGNPDLKPEEAVTYEAGIKYAGKLLNGHISYFRRDGKNIIDWGKANATDDKWQSLNLTELSTDGVEISMELLTNPKSPITYFNVSYSYLNTTKSSGDYISYYALDYLKHRFTVNLHHKIIRNLSASWAYSYNNRAGSYLEYPSNTEKAFKPYSLFDGRITFKRFLYSLYLESSNIFNKSYADLGNIIMPGRWVKAGLIIKVNY